MSVFDRTSVAYNPTPTMQPSQGALHSLTFARAFCWNFVGSLSLTTACDWCFAFDACCSLPLPLLLSLSFLGRTGGRRLFFTLRTPALIPRPTARRFIVFRYLAPFPGSQLGFQLLPSVPHASSSCTDTGPVTIRGVMLHTQKLVQLGVGRKQDLGWCQAVILGRSFLVFESSGKIPDLNKAPKAPSVAGFKFETRWIRTDHILIIQLLVVLQSLLDLLLLLGDRQSLLIINDNILDPFFTLALVLFLVLLLLSLFSL